MKLALFKKYFPVFLFCYHLLFAYVAWVYILENNGDAVRYWFVGQDLSQKSWLSFFKPGTDVIKLLTFPFVKFLHLPFWSGFLLFSLFSYMGFYRLWKTILALTKNNTTAFLIGVLLLLLPNLHLWTSFIGKEAVLFTFLILFLEQVIRGHFASVTLMSSFAVIALIRPHVGLVLFLSLIAALLIKGNLISKLKIQLLLFTSVVVAVLYMVLRHVARIKENPWDRILHMYDYHIKGLRKTAAYVPLDEYHLPYKLFTFYFRPLPLEKEGWFYMIWSLENMFLLILCGAGAYLVIRYELWAKIGVFGVFAALFLLFYGVMYVYAYANFGLIARTKSLVLPVVYLLFLKIWAAKKQIIRRKRLEEEMLF